MSSVVDPLRIPWKSGIYQGWIRHRRYRPRPHHFRFPLFMMYLDLAEVGELFRDRWLWASERWAPACFLRKDFLGDPSTPLAQAAQDLVEERTGRRPRGAVRLLTHLRYLGYIFNPLKLYYCFGEARRDGTEPLEAVIAEVHNTPWGEVHTYVLSWDPGGAAGGYSARHGKTFHVSPFLPMELSYAWRFSEPGGSLVVHLGVCREEDPAQLFDATLVLRRREIDGRSLASAWIRHPWMTGAVVAGIYFQAARLWWKRTPFFPHPKTRSAAPDGKEGPGHGE